MIKNCRWQKILKPSSGIKGPSNSDFVPGPVFVSADEHSPRTGGMVVVPGCGMARPWGRVRGGVGGDGGGRRLPGCAARGAAAGQDHLRRRLLCDGPRPRLHLDLHWQRRAVDRCPRPLPLRCVSRFSNARCGLSSTCSTSV